MQMTLYFKQLDQFQKVAFYRLESVNAHQAFHDTSFFALNEKGYYLLKN